MNKSLLLTILLSITIQASFASENILQLKVNGKHYSHLTLKMSMSHVNSIYIQGKKETDDLWIFQISDSIYEHSMHMTILIPTNDSVVHQLILSYATKNDTIRTMQFFTKKKLSKLTLNYEKTEIRERVAYLENKMGVYDYFSISTNDSEFESSMIKLHTLFGFFNRLFSYEENLSKYISIVKKYSNSHSLIAGLYSTINKYKSKNDIETVLFHFSDFQKKSYYGQLIQSYLYAEKFPDIQLCVLGEERLESVITNTEKENLIIFTASWCQPCHKLIPVLKDIYTNFKDKLIFTYISIDDSKTIANWPKIIEENEIPWRCLVATEKLDEVMKIYTIQGIPLAYHVLTDGSFKKINLQNSEEREILVRDFFSKLK